MPAKRLSMRKIKEVLRLKRGQGLSNRKIAAACGIARPTVSEYLRRAEECLASIIFAGRIASIVLLPKLNCCLI